MNIKGIEGDFSPIDPVKGKKGSSSAKETSGGKDKVQVSGDAKTLFEATHAARLEEVKARLDGGFYMKPEVVEKIIDGVLVDLLKTP